MLIAGRVPLATQYDQILAETRAEYVVEHPDVAAKLEAFAVLPVYTIVWLAINRTRFVRQECSSERSN